MTPEQAKLVRGWTYFLDRLQDAVSSGTGLELNADEAENVHAALILIGKGWFTR